MKIPGSIEFGVQSLGRPDASAMRFKASAEQDAAMAWGKALSDTGKQVQEIAINEAAADATLTLSERVAMDKKSTAELDAWLANNPTFNADAATAVPLPDANGRLVAGGPPPVPAAVRAAVERLGMSGNVDTYEIAIEASKQQFEQSRKASMEAMAKKHMSEKAIAAYNQQMDTTWARSASSATQTHILQRIQHLSARADMMYTEALNRLDEEAMWQIAVESENSGIWTPEYAGAKAAAIGATVDQVTATRMYHDAVTQDDIDVANVFVDRSRIDPAARMAMMKLSDQRQEHQFKLEQRKQPVNYAKAQASLIKGALTKDMVADMANNQEISGAHANTLRLALDSVTPLASTPEVFDRLLGHAAGLQFSQDGDLGKISERADALRKSAYAQFTGAGSDGSPISRSLTGKDFEAVMAMIDKYENIGLGKGGQKYTVAARSIKAHTGYSDNITKMIKGPYPAGQAKAAFDAALMEYMELDGSDPVNWVTQNAHRFTAKLYSEAVHKRLAAQFPQYSEKIMSLVDGVGIKGVTVGTVLWNAQRDYQTGRLPQEQYQTLLNGLDYLVIEAQEAAEEAEVEEAILPGAG